MKDLWSKKHLRFSSVILIITIFIALTPVFSTEAHASYTGTRYIVDLTLCKGLSKLHPDNNWYTSDLRYITLEDTTAAIASGGSDVMDCIPWGFAGYDPNIIPTGTAESEARLCLRNNQTYGAQLQIRYLNQWVSFKIHIPKAGRYSSFLTYARASYGGIGNVYLAPWSEDASTWRSASYLIGSVNFYNSTLISTNMIELNTVDITAKGDYVLTFLSAQKPGQGNNIYPHDLTLKEVAQVGVDFSQSAISSNSITNSDFTVNDAESQTSTREMRTVGDSKSLHINVFGQDGSFWPADTSMNSRFTAQVSVPATGDYALRLQGYKWYNGCIASVYIDDQYAGDYSFYNGDETKSLPEQLGDEKRLNSLHLTSGTHNISFRSRSANDANPNLLLYKMYLDPVDSLAHLNSVTANAPQVLTVGSTGTVSAQAIMSDTAPYNFGLTSAGAADTANTVTVTSSNESVAAVSNVSAANIGSSDTPTATITPVATGFATITVTATVGGVTKTVSKMITVGKKTIAAPIQGNLTATATGIANSNISSTQYTSGGSAQSFNVGDEVTLTAPATADGKTFRYWKNVNSKKIVTTDNACIIKIGSNTYLTAVYTKADTGTLVEFIDRNGKVLQSSYINDSNPTITPPADPYSVGYVFKNWSPSLPAQINSSTVTSDTVFSAIYDKSTNTYNVTVTGSTADGTTAYAYNDAVTVTASVPDGQTFAYWTKNGNIISNETTYTFYVWDNATVSAVYVIGDAPAKLPQIMLDTVKTDGTRVIFASEREVPSGYELIESGILLYQGDASEDTFKIDGTYTAKAISQSSSRQFTVRRDNATGTWSGRAYLIYKVTATGECAVIYSDIGKNLLG